LYEPGTPPELLKSSVIFADGAGLKSEHNLLGSQGRNIFGAFLPAPKHGSGIGDCKDGGGIVLNKDQGPNPDGEIV